MTTESRPPVVLQVLPALAGGGVERGTVDVAKAAAAAGWVSLVASAGGRMVYELARGGAEHVELPLASKNPYRVFANAGRLAQLIRLRQVDIVHARSRAPAWSARAACRRVGVPFVTTFHGRYGAGNPIKRAYNRVMASGDRVIAISDFIADHIRETYKIDPARLVTIHRGVDLDVFDPAAVSAERMVALANEWRIRDDRRVIVMPGRLTSLKGHEVMIEALAKLDRHDFMALFVGEGPNGAKLERLAVERGLAEVVRFTGHCADMAAAYMLADVVASTSTAPEGFGRVAVEAQAMGRPVVATDHGGARETVRDGRTGYLVKPGDAGELAAALAQALSLDEAARANVAAEARDYVSRRYSVNTMCQATLSLYESLLGQ